MSCLHSSEILWCALGRCPMIDRVGRCNGLLGGNLPQAEFVAMKKKPDDKTPKLGFTFSFPCEQTAVNAGRLICWTKVRLSLPRVSRPRLRPVHRACSGYAHQASGLLRGLRLQGFACCDGPGFDVCELLQRELEARRRPSSWAT